jgi:hypothetical protein
MYVVPSSVMASRIRVAREGPGQRFTVVRDEERLRAIEFGAVQPLRESVLREDARDFTDAAHAPG